MPLKFKATLLMILIYLLFSLASCFVLPDLLNITLALFICFILSFNYFDAPYINNCCVLLILTIGIDFISISLYEFVNICGDN
jgi:hypothetical protein